MVMDPENRSKSPPLDDNSPIDCLIKKVSLDIPNLHLHTEEERIQYFSKCLILAPKNVDITAINNIVQEYLSGETAHSKTVEYVIACQEYLNTHFSWHTCP
jgi:hypothetical protein